MARLTRCTKIPGAQHTKQSGPSKGGARVGLCRRPREEKQWSSPAEGTNCGAQMERGNWQQRWWQPTASKPRCSGSRTRSAFGAGEQGVDTGKPDTPLHANHFGDATPSNQVTSRPSKANAAVLRRFVCAWLPMEFQTTSRERHKEEALTTRICSGALSSAMRTVKCSNGVHSHVQSTLQRWAAGHR